MKILVPLDGSAFGEAGFEPLAHVANSVLPIHPANSLQRGDRLALTYINQNANTVTHRLG